MARYPISKAKAASGTVPVIRWAGLAAGTIAAMLAWSAAKAEGDIIVSHGYSTFGDLKYPADFPHLDYVNPEAPKGGEISQWAQGTFDSFNNYTRKGRAGALSTVGHESILTTVADDINASYCLLCTTMEYPESKDWVIFNLRPEVRFSDGRPFMASDIKFAFELFMEQGLPSFRAAFGAQIESVEVLGDHRVKFNFTPEAPRRDVIELAGIFPAFSESWFEETGARLDESSLVPILGTGQYQLESYDVNRRIVYERNPDYWGADLPINVGRGNFDKIRVEYFADSSAAFEAFKSGAYTFRNEISSKEWATSYNFPAVDNGWVKVEELPDGNISSGQSFVFNLRREKFQDPRVREAIGLMFNFEWSNETLFYGLYERITSFWGNSDLEATGVPNEAELALLEPLVAEGLLDESILTDEVRMPPPSGNRQLDRRNLRRASALLDEAGWEVGDDGMRRKNGQLLTVEFLESSPAFDRIINPYVQNLQRLGIQAKLDRVDPSQATDRERNYDYDMATHSFNLGFEPSTGLKQWFGSEAMDESTRNLMGLSDPAVDRLIDVIVAAENREEMQTGVRVLDRVLRAKLFWVPQWFKDVHTVAYYDMFEYPEPLPAFSRGELDFWWYNEDKAQALREAGAIN
ncbi:MAG: ABC transporter substrate-binding protein [Rhodobacteraceae bacterium]|nr:extracellular solute-binding protein [Alphaproteobacteria bacterium]NNF71791.1 ABC transporter substrate-binding protein [Paracoccaceae bacterium]NNK65785.1 ABC transporter substrate-binding protein [Paracoccaceae bacterium]